LKSGQQVTIQGDGSARRSFLHVEDTCSAFEIILESGTFGEIYNIGTDQEYSVLEIAEILVRLIKGTSNFQSYVTFIKDRPFNDSRYFISNQKLVNLGWIIKKDFMEGLTELI
jgi:dTDP-glucose 4,6-dehydratase/UDP-glucose 4,6-dehydratase